MKVGKEFFPENQLDRIFEALDINNNGQIDYTEFQMLFCHHELADEKILFEQFDLLDVVSLNIFNFFYFRLRMERLIIMKSSIILVKGISI